MYRACCKWPWCNYNKTGTYPIVLIYLIVPQKRDGKSVVDKIVKSIYLALCWRGGLDSDVLVIIGAMHYVITSFVLMSEPRQPKKRKFSGLSGLELQLAYNAVFKLKETFTYVESVNPEGAQLGPNDDFDQRVLEILAIFEARMKVPQARVLLRNGFPRVTS